MCGTASSSSSGTTGTTTTGTTGTTTADNNYRLRQQRQATTTGTTGTTTTGTTGTITTGTTGTTTPLGNQTADTGPITKNNILSRSILSKTNVLIFTFSTDYIVTRTGWSANWTTVTPGIG